MVKALDRKASGTKVKIKQGGSRKAVTTVDLPDEILNALYAIAADEERPLAQIIRRTLKKGLGI